jgi:long-chain acyl-CoA synthetase
MAMSFIETNFVPHKKKSLIQDYLQENLIKYPLSIALSDETNVFTYTDVAHSIQKFHHMYSDLGIKKGDVIGIEGDPSVETVIALLSVICFGAIAMPVNPALSAGEIKVLTEHAGCNIVLSAPSSKLTIGGTRIIPVTEYENYSPTEIHVECGEEDKVLLIYTSGTTGKPKGIALTHKNIISNVIDIANNFKLSDNHKKICILPVFHLFGLISDILTMLFTGGSCYIFKNFGFLSLSKFLSVIRNKNINSFSGVPFIYEMLNKGNISFAGTDIQFCVTGAAPLKSETASVFIENNPLVTLFPGYGMSETTCYSTINPADKIKYNSIGKPAPFNEMGITDDDENFLPALTVGELVIKGDNVMKGGYFKNDIDTYLKSDKGYLKTGDIAYYDEEGYFFIVGRKKNLVIRGGMKVYLEDVNQAVMKHTSVADCVSVMIDKGDEHIIAFVELKQDCNHSSNEILKVVRDGFHSSLVPDRLQIIEEIPRTPTRKPRMKDLEMLAQELLNNGNKN